MDSPVKFSPYDGDLMGLYVDPNYLVFRWHGPGKVLFSVARRGNAASCHFSSDKNGLRYIKTAISQFVDFVFWLYDWCTMVLAQVERPSVGRLISKVGFMPVAEAGDKTVYVRHKSWAA